MFSGGQVAVIVLGRSICGGSSNIKYHDMNRGISAGLSILIVEIVKRVDAKIDPCWTPLDVRRGCRALQLVYARKGFESRLRG